MQYGCCVNMLPDVGTLAGARYFEPLKALGYDYVEMPLKTLASLSPLDFSTVRHMLQDSGLPCRICNDFMPSDFRIVGPETTPRIVREAYFHRAFALMGPDGIQAEMAVYGSPWSKNCPEGFNRDTAWQQIKDFLLDVSKIAESHGISICIEFNNRLETNMITRFSDSLRMASEIEHPNLSVHCDYYHIIMENDDPAVILSGGERIRHVHIAELDRAYLTERDFSNQRFRSFADILKNHIGYDRTISMESRPHSAESWFGEAQTCLAILRKVFG